VVVGDASGSMEVAIKTATIITSILTVLCNAQLRFFHDKNFLPPILPQTIKEVIKVAEEVKATGSTAPAASLWESYHKKEIVKHFVIATDEEENTPSNGYRWAPLFKKYLDEVYADAKLCFVSFLNGGSAAVGQMVTELEALGIKPLQFKFHRTMPDLTKLDSLLALLSSESGQFKKQSEEFASIMTSNGGDLRPLLTKLIKPEDLPIGIPPRKLRNPNSNSN